MPSGRSRLLRQHLGDVAVAAGGIEAQRRARRARARRIARKHAGGRAEPAVHFGGAAMHAADPGIGSAADDRQPQRAPEPLPQSRHAASRRVRLHSKPTVNPPSAGSDSGGECHRDQRSSVPARPAARGPMMLAPTGEAECDRMRHVVGAVTRRRNDVFARASARRHRAARPRNAALFADAASMRASGHRAGADALTDASSPGSIGRLGEADDAPFRGGVRRRCGAEPSGRRRKIGDTRIELDFGSGMPLRRRGTAGRFTARVRSLGQRHVRAGCRRIPCRHC